LTAAEGWLELGNWLEANEELESITPQMRGHSKVLCLRWQIYAKAGRWEMASEVGRSLSILVPDDALGWIHWAFALHEMKHTKELMMWSIPWWPNSPMKQRCHTIWPAIAASLEIGKRRWIG
jgi:hypothetical protein